MWSFPATRRHPGGGVLAELRPLSSGYPLAAPLVAAPTTSSDNSSSFLISGHHPAATHDGSHRRSTTTINKLRHPTPSSGAFPASSDTPTPSAAPPLALFRRPSQVSNPQTSAAATFQGRPPTCRVFPATLEAAAKVSPCRPLFRQPEQQDSSRSMSFRSSGDAPTTFRRRPFGLHDGFLERSLRSKTEYIVQGIVSNSNRAK